MSSFFSSFQFPQSKLTRMYLGIGVLGLLALSVFIFAIFISSDDGEVSVIDPSPNLESSPVVAAPTLGKSCCYVEVSGGVQKPGVYLVGESARIQDVITQAGGFIPDADSSYIAKQINLAKKIEDQEKIFIPFRGNNEDLHNDQKPKNGFSVNEATQEQLESLPFVGKKKAEKIISGRPYSSMEEFFSRNSFSQTQQEELQKLITF